MEPLEAYVDAVATAIGLPVEEAHRPGVVAYLKLAAGLAQRVMEFPLATHDEPAAIFRPVSPPAGPGDAS
ncbi:MAG: hypothetical protein RIS35_83 [Pseudomonadota bacterium]|jgi:hypothetical protein